MTLSEQQVDKLHEMWENGCPTTEHIYKGEQICWFCNAPEELYSRGSIYYEIDHNVGCPWLTLEELFG